VARERLLIVSTGHPRRRVRELARSADVKIANAYQASSWAVHDLAANRDNPEWVGHARKTHAEAMATMEDLIQANFGWHVLGRRTRSLASAAGARMRLSRRSADARTALDQPGGQDGG
jgi:hypothetical protein